MLAPPWIPVPPSGYGGIEAVVDVLCAELVALGHEVTLFAAPGSRSAAAVQPLLDRAYPDAIGSAMHESDHVARAFAMVDAAADGGRPYDVVHDHSGFAALALADRLATPMVHTLHGPFTPETWAFYAQHGAKAAIVAISETQLAGAPPALRSATVIPNPIDVAAWPWSDERDDYLLWIGRMTEEKGPHRAIEAARLAGRRLILAGPVQVGQEHYFQHHVEPAVDGDRVRYVGEVAGEAKTRLFAHAAALLMPIRWTEPFGMVMIEALVSGTPVIAFPEGAAVEIVEDGVTGFLVDDERAMAAAVGRLTSIDGAACRASVAARYDAALVARGYVAAYRDAARRTAREVIDRDRRARAGEVRRARRAAEGRLRPAAV